jgi:N-acetylneuraminate synthase/N,N'-diacetyllegionaminate synthase
VTGFPIGARMLGPGQRPYVIAEVGVNHNGSIDLAKQSIDAAAACGVDAVKFQSFRAEEFVADHSLTYSYAQSGAVVTENVFDMFKRLEMPPSWHRELIRYCVSKGVDFLSSPADALSADSLAKLNVGAIKLASEDLINRPLLRHVGALGRPVILSTGMADYVEVDEALAAITGAGCKDIMLLHCVSLYPTPDGEVNLNRMVALKERYDLPTGFSDHSVGVTACIGAVALGAQLVEKHFTLDRELPGPDHSLSADPEEMRELVAEVRRITAMLGTAAIRPSPGELGAMKDFRRSITLSADVEPGAVLEAGLLCLKRPAKGLHPRHLDDVIGKRARHFLKANQPLTWSDVE